MIFNKDGSLKIYLKINLFFSLSHYHTIYEGKKGKKIELLWFLKIIYYGVL